MIFKRLFSSSYKSNSPQKRIESIAKLDPSISQDKQALHEMAFNDEDKHVSLAALEKLASFALWQKMSQIARDPYVKREAQRFVEQTILGQNSYKLSDDERCAYLLESANNELRMRYLNEKPNEQSDNVTLKLLDKVNAISFTQRFINEQASLNLQKLWVESATDKKVLQKLKNKTTSPQFSEAISQRLTELKDAEEKPVLISRQATFVLSKLQALSERNNYEQIFKQSRELKEEFEELREAFSLLQEDKKDELEDKFARISKKVETVLARLAPEWEEQQAKAEHERRMQNLRHLADLLSTQTHSLLTIEEDKLESVVTDVSKKRDQLYQELQQAEAVNPDFSQQEFIACADKASDILANLATFREHCKQAQAIIIESEELFEYQTSSFDEKRDKQQKLQDKWSSVTSLLPIIPGELKKKWQSVSARWKEKFKDVDATQGELVKICKHQLNTINGLIDKGKFNPAITKFTKLAKNFIRLSSGQQARLQNKFDKVRERVERLEGWKNYLAAPRRPELIEQAQTLASEPVDSIKERAEKIKYLRKQWQSLGPISSENEQAVQFDNLIEQAFIPCREHYAKQEKLREQIKVNRQRLIEEARNLDLNQDSDTLSTQYEKLRASWWQEGRLDNETWHRIKREWDEVIRPVTAKINEWYLQNRQRKQKLIDQVESQLNSDDINSAADIAKQAQQQWKSIGYAGSKDENKLWQTFRKINDDIFARVNASHQKSKAEYEQKKGVLLDEIQSRTDKIIESHEIADAQEISQIESQIDGAGLAKDRAVKSAFDKLMQANKQEGKRQQASERQQQLDALLSAIPLFHAGESPESKLPAEVWQRLDKNQQGWFTLAQPSNDSSRAHLTTKLEWITGIESPSDAQDERRRINLEQLAEKMEHNHVADFETVLGQWVSCGPLSEDEDVLFERLTRCVHKQIADLENIVQ